MWQTSPSSPLSAYAALGNKPGGAASMLVRSLFLAKTKKHFLLKASHGCRDNYIWSDENQCNQLGIVLPHLEPIKHGGSMKKISFILATPYTSSTDNQLWVSRIWVSKIKILCSWSKGRLRHIRCCFRLYRSICGSFPMKVTRRTVHNNQNWQNWHSWFCKRHWG